MKKLRVLALMHEALIPPDSIEGLTDKDMAPWKTEYDVLFTLEELGHESLILGVCNELDPIGQTLRDWKPHIVFNLLEEFNGQATHIPYILAYFELLKQPYTGCNPLGLSFAYNKALAKKLLSYHDIPMPRFQVFPREQSIQRPKHLSFPLIVKSDTDHGSVGISHASIVRGDRKLKERVEYIHDQIRTDAIVEEYIDGRELYVGVIGNSKLQTLPIWEMFFPRLPDSAPRIATSKIKWDLNYQTKIGLKTRAATNLPRGVPERIAQISKRVYRILGQSGYARMDFRLAPDGGIYLLESNPRPDLAYGEDFAESAHKMGIRYEELIQRIVTLGLGYQRQQHNAG